MKPYHFFLLLFLVSLSTMTTRAQSAGKSESLRVEIMIFSGRPNPVFEITDPKEIREIMALAGNLPAPAARSAPEAVSLPRAQLGYRGIRVLNASAESPDVSSLKVFRTDVEVQRATARTSVAGTKEERVDANVNLERRLLALAHAHGAVDDKLLELINRAE